MKRILFAAALLFAGSAQAGNIYLTGHDTLLHAGQNGYDTVILDYLREGTAKAGYSVAVVGNGAGFFGFTGGSYYTGSTLANGAALALNGALVGYESATYYDLDNPGWTAALTADVLVILSHTSCGGCDVTTAGADALEANAGLIAAAFNAGMDIWANSGASDTTFYNFLPPGAVASGLPIGGSSGFTATADGLALGITTTMINGHPTHNRFTGFAPGFTVMETRSTEIISLGLRGGTIVDDVIVTDDVVTDDVVAVPEPGTMLLIGSGILGLGLLRRRRTA